MGVLLALLLHRGVLVSQQSRLLDEVGHGALIALGADLQARLVGRPRRVRLYALLAVGLGVVYGPK